MANEKRLIYLEDAIEKIVNFPSKVAHDAFHGRKQFTPLQMLTVVADRQHEIIELLKKVKEVDAVEVDEIRVDIMRLCLENQEAIMNVSICGKPNEVKLPFSKEVVEVVHSSWILNDDGSGTCKHCHRTTKSCWDFDNQMNYCPNCGATMDLE